MGSGAGIFGHGDDDDHDDDPGESREDRVARLSVARRSLAKMRSLRAERAALLFIEGDRDAGR